MSAATTTMMNAQLPHPHRKPVPARASYNNLQQAHQQQQQQAQVPYGGDQQRTYTRTMTSSTGSSPAQSNAMYAAPPAQQQGLPNRDRRTLSNATTSTTSTQPGLQRAPTTSSLSQPRRSTSSRSTGSGSPTSYVALMRKQKATVWCDRAQLEDPRILAAQRAQKMRAAMEVAGGAHRYSTSSNNASQSTTFRSKIRHHGLPKANAYSGHANLAGAGVPLRLSATEVDENDSDEEMDAKYANRYHSRTGSRGSSMGSGRAPNQNYLSSGRGYNGSSNSTPRSGHSPTDVPAGDEEPTPVPQDYQSRNSDGYFAGVDAEEEEKSFGRVSGLPQRASGRSAEEERKVSEDLKRRGSVDDRTMTMSAGRLFVANPDLSD